MGRPELGSARLFSAAITVDSALIFSADANACGSQSVADASSPPTFAWFAFDQQNPILKGLGDPTVSLRDFSPIVLYGPSGCGKSSLAQVLANAHLATRKARFKSRAAAVVTSINDFDRRMRHAAVVGHLDETLATWEKPECWIVENFHRFSGSPFVDQLLVQLLDQRTASGRLTIFAGQQAPWRGCKFSPRLESRLSAGLPILVNHPGLTALRKIAEWTALSLGLTWDADALASVLQSKLSVRSIVQFLRRIADSRNPLQAISLETVKSLVAEYHKPMTIAAELILTTVARHFRLKLAELVGPSRRQSLIKARGVAICLLRDLGDMKWQAIADATGRQDHSTVLHAYAKTQQSLTSDPILADTFRQVQQKLLQHDDTGKQCG